MEFSNPNEAVQFFDFLSYERKLGARTIEIYMTYYKLFDGAQCNIDYVTKFVRKHNNTPALRGFLKNYFEFRHIEIELPGRPKGRKPVRLPRDISEEELETLRNHFYSKSFKKGLIFDLIYQGALRRVEIITIKLNSFKWNRWLEDTSKFCRLIVLGKGNKEREVLINPETAESIAMYYLKKHDLISFEDIKEVLNQDILLFATAKGEPLNEDIIYTFIRRESKSVLRSRHIRPHELRHCRSTELENKGVSIKDIQRYLGHSKIGTTEIYLHRSFEKAIDSVENHLQSED